MKILAVVQRYGAEIAAGAEGAARSICERLAGRGHTVEVVTSRAQSYIDWADRYDEGTSTIDGVTVHRLSVTQPRDLTTFNRFNARVAAGPTPLHVQERWMALQGPVLRGYREWLRERAGDFDVAVFFTYLYWPTWAGLPVASGRVPTVLVPLAHDEPTFHLPLFRPILSLPDAFAFLTAEEEALVLRRSATPRRSAITHLGIQLLDDLDDVEEGSGPDRRSVFDTGGEPYLLYVGRIDESKGAHELAEWFIAMQGRRRRPVRLVLVGDPVQPLPGHPDVLAPGIVDEATVRSAMAGALALVNPSYFESFSLVLAEAWALARPALVPAASPVLAGQVRHSGGGLTYSGFAELEAAVDLLLEDPALADPLGLAGRRYAREQFRWDAVLDRFESLLRATARAGRRSVATAR